MKKWVLSVWIVLAVILSVSSVSLGRSVFAVASHSNGKIKAYYIDPNSAITFQTTIPYPLEEATGLCLWPEKDRMFVTYEGEGEISWASIKNLNRDPSKDNYDTVITEGNGLGGMAVDEANSRLYVIARNTNHLYAFDYDEVENTLIPIPLDEATMYRELDEVGNGIDIALDSTGSTVMEMFDVGRLYVSDASEAVQYYNTTTWEHEGTIEFEQGVIGIGLDISNQYLYGGNFNGTGGHSFLMRMPLDGDPNDYVEKNMGFSVMDISVDEDSGYIYLTTNRNHDGHDGAVEVYDPTSWTPSEPNSLILWDIESDNDFEDNGPGGIAVGPSFKPPSMYIQKVDDVNELTDCVVLNEIYHYTITYRPGFYDEPNVVIIDYLPWGVDFISAYPDDPNWCYYTERPVHTYTWELGDVPGYDPNDPLAPPDPNYYFELTVRVNQWANPSGILYNKVTAESDLSYNEDDEITPVCCWNSGIIYVDRYAPGAKTGIDWENAYTDLQDAIERALEGCGSEIWIADGVYRPGKTEDNTFGIPDDVEVYGGYAGYGATDPNERDWKKYKTILSGYVNETTKNNSVVTMGNDSLLDGVTVEKGGYYGIFSNGDDFSIENSLIENNYQKGIYCNNGNSTVEWCEIRNNEQQGIHHIGSGFSLSINNCNIHNNFRDGILAEYSMLELRNSVICENGSDDSYYGININNSGSNSEIRNNTIVHNSNEGIRHAGTNQPDVRNNILWHNNMQDELQKQLVGISARYYNCIYDPNDPQGSSTPDANGNITADPNFAYSYPVYGYYHINSGSPCRDMGDPDEQNYVQADEVDMDGDDRDLDGNVDMGADEVACEDTSNPIDWNGDGIINLKEFSILSSAWLTQDPNSPSYPNPNNPDPNDVYAWYVLDAGPKADLNQDSYVDLYDLIEFCEDSPQGWLWQACWHENYVEMMRMGIDSSIAAPPMSLSLPASKIIQSKSVYREPDPETMEKTILEILDYVDLRIQEKDENIEGLYDMKIFLEECLVDIQNDKLRTSF